MLRRNGVRLPTLVLSALGALVSACTEPEPAAAEYFVFGTVVEVELHDADPELAKPLFASLQEQLQRMHREWHAWEPGELERVNEHLRSARSADTTPEIVELVTKSREMERRSGGRFNPAIGQLIRIWGFHTSEFPIVGAPPAASDIEAVLQHHPSTLDIEVNGLELRSSNPAVQLDFGAIAKGYAVDLAMDLITSAGVGTALVNAGGDMKTAGSPAGRPWKIAVKDPSGGLAGSIEFKGSRAVFTSGNYQRYRQHATQRYPHIIDPRTGWPVRHIASATVVAAEGVVADSVATALMVASETEWQEIATNMGAEAFLIIDEGGTIFASTTMAELFTPQPGRAYKQIE